jgi:hypothetical protein
MNKYLIFLIIAISLACCDSRNNVNMKRSVITDVKPAYKKHFIDVNFEEVNAKLKSGKMSDQEKNMRVNKVYAAFYRAYQHLEIKNGLYNLKVNTGKDIGISPMLFKIIKSSLDDANKKLMEARKENPGKAITPGDGKLMERKYWDWEFCMEGYKKYGK